MRRSRNDIVPIHDSKNPCRDCFYGWSVIIGMSLIALTVIAVGIVLLLTYSPAPTTTTTNWPSRATTTTTTFQPSDTLFSNTVLQQKEYLLSNNNVYYAIIQEDGNFVVYRYLDSQPVKAIWSSGTGGRPLSAGAFSVVMQSDGNLVINSVRSGPIWDSHTSQKGPEPHKLVMQDNGNLVIYDGRGRVQWVSN